MSRRWGRVTVEGWIGDGTVVVPPDQTAYWTFPASVATVEYLPEPVVFKDGDAVYSTFDGATRVRVAGRWVWACDGTPVVHYGDDFYAGRVVDGSMLRVGAPVTP